MSKPAAVPMAPDETTTFYLPKSEVIACLQAVKIIQQHKITGKGARKLGRIRRVLHKANEELQEQFMDLAKAHAEKNPEGHEKAGEPTVVYEMKQDKETGEMVPVYKKDQYGQDTAERSIIHGQYNLINVMDYQREQKEMLKEIMIIECPAFHVQQGEKDLPTELEKFSQVEGAAVDALMALEKGSYATKSPAGMQSLELVKDEEPEQVQEEISEEQPTGF